MTSWNCCKILLITCIITLMIPTPIHATPILADISQYRIEIDSSFTGTRLFLFGVRNNTGDVVVVVRGPAKNYMMRKKEPIMGIWANRDRMKFYDVPDFYAVATSKHLNKIEQKSLFKRLAIGEETLMTPPLNPKALKKFNEYRKAFLEHQQRNNLYTTIPEKLNFMGETLFKTVIEFPDTIPAGDYVAEIYLISDGKITGMQSTPIKVSKSGLDAFLHDYAHNHPTFYGLAAVFMALGAGWFASRIFEKI